MTTTPDRRAARGRDRQAPTATATAAGPAEQTEPPSAIPSQLPAGAGPGTRPPRDAPRWVRWTVLPLLVLVPIGYVAISAQQSREGGESKEQEAAARHLVRDEPSSLQQRIYQVDFPSGAVSPAYLETNSWDVSVLYAQFTTTAGGLDTFLAKIGTSRPALQGGGPAISAAQVKATGWNFVGYHSYAGIKLRQAGDKPDHDIAVDLTYPDTPTVFVVSTVNFQHGFGGG